MAWISQVVGAALQVAGTIGGNLAAGKTRKNIGKIGNRDPAYTESPYAAEQYGMAKNLYNSRMAGAIDMSRGIEANQANTFSNINRGATDSSQLLALAGGVQGQTNQAYGKLALMQNQDKQQKLQNVIAGQQAMTAEHKDLFDDKVRRWQDELGIEMKKGEIRQQQWGNVSNLGSSISGMGTMGFGGGK
jgi:hypothetical protein